MIKMDQYTAELISSFYQILPNAQLTNQVRPNNQIYTNGAIKRKFGEIK